jgi:uncharacterized protein YbgA (DUF1722 family)
MERPRVGVSSCLLGSPVRFDGGHKRFRFLTDELGPYVDWVPYCPAADYGELFLAALAERATRGRNANALLHAYSRIGRALAAPRRSDLVARIDAYRRGEVPLSVPVALLAHYASGGDLPWLESQTFLAPFPAELRLRHAV